MSDSSNVFAQIISGILEILVTVIIMIILRKMFKKLLIWRKAKAPQNLDLT